MKLLHCILLLATPLISCVKDNANDNIRNYFNKNDKSYPNVKIVLSNGFDNTLPIGAYKVDIDTVYYLELEKNTITVSDKNKIKQRFLNLDELIYVYSRIEKINDLCLINIEQSESLSLILSINNRLKVASDDCTIPYLTKHNRSLGELIQIFYSVSPMSLNLNRDEE